MLLAVPFSLVGAFWFLYLLGYNMSIAVWVGLIALAGSILGAIYPGFRRWLGETAGDRRQEIMNSLSRADAPAPVRRLRQVQAWLLEFALDRSVLPIAGVLRLRDYVLVVATKPE